MMARHAIDLELGKRLKEEQNRLGEYEGMLASMTMEEKEGLREWMAGGNSIGSNPFSLYAENGCLMDFVTASRIIEEMVANPEDFQ